MSALDPEDYHYEYCKTCIALNKDRKKAGSFFVSDKYWCNKYGCWRDPDSSACTGYVRNPQCFLTTACVKYKGLPDDCKELTLLRKFRDEYMKKTEEGSALVEQYYEIAPGIVTKIDARADKAEIYEKIYKNILLCVEKIEANEYEQTFKLYSDMVKELNDLVNN